MTPEERTLLLLLANCLAKIYEQHNNQDRTKQIRRAVQRVAGHK